MIDKSKDSKITFKYLPMINYDNNYYIKTNENNSNVGYLVVHKLKNIDMPFYDFPLSNVPLHNVVCTTAPNLYDHKFSKI